jgi:hypothetical protein
MAHLISFKTTKFDPAREPENPINPIPGHSVLAWLRVELAKPQCTSTEPDAEDWGWYINVEMNGTMYMVGAGTDGEEAGPDVEWLLQVHKSRSFTDKLFGRSKMDANDPLVARIESILRADPQIQDVSIEREAN